MATAAESGFVVVVVVVGGGGGGSSSRTGQPNCPVQEKHG
jgi:hypothetical protein